MGGSRTSELALDVFHPKQGGFSKTLATFCVASGGRRSELCFTDGKVERLIKSLVVRSGVSFGPGRTRGPLLCPWLSLETAERSHPHRAATEPARGRRQINSAVIFLPSCNLQLLCSPAFPGIRNCAYQPH